MSLCFWSVSSIWVSGAWWLLMSRQSCFCCWLPMPNCPVSLRLTQRVSEKSDSSSDCKCTLYNHPPISTKQSICSLQPFLFDCQANGLPMSAGSSPAEYGTQCKGDKDAKHGYTNVWLCSIPPHISQVSLWVTLPSIRIRSLIGCSICLKSEQIFQPFTFETVLHQLSDLTPDPPFTPRLTHPKSQTRLK